MIRKSFFARFLAASLSRVLNFSGSFNLALLMCSRFILLAFSGLRVRNAPSK